MRDINFRDIRNYSDIIHGTIPYNGFEGIVLQTPLLLRLQRISQNSLVFLTFPSNKVKRFEHSLGVMHLASAFIRAALINTETTTLDHLFSAIKVELETWVEKLPRNKPEPLSNYPRDCFGMNGRDVSAFTKMEKSELTDNSFFNMLIPSNINNEQYILCAALFQGLRLAGLLHDLGHLPYSHTLEEIIKNLNTELKDKTPKNDLENTFLELAKDYESGHPLHEELSKSMLSVVEGEVADAICEWDKEHTNDRIYTLLSIFSFRIAQCVLYEKGNFLYKCFHNVVSGTVDVDRLDYASRDLLCSAVTSDIINYDRLFLYCAIRPRSDYYVVAYDVKSMKDIEAFLRKRWQIYRDIDYHHSVHKSELIMRKTLIAKAKSSFAENCVFDNVIQVNDKALPSDFILGIMLILKHLKADGNQDSLRKYLLLLDDSWLDTLMKRSDDDNAFDNELIYGRQTYKTLVKRFDDYLDFDELVFSEFCKYVDELLGKSYDAFHNLDSLSEEMPAETSYDEENMIVEEINNLLDDIKEFETHQTFLVNCGQLFTNCLLDLLNNLFAVSKNRRQIKPLELFIDSIASSESFNHDGILVGAISFGTGVPDDEDEDTDVDELWNSKKNALVEFKKYSSIKTDLEYEKGLLPPLHIFIKNDEDGDACIQRLGELFCKFFVDSLANYTDECLAGSA